MGRIAGRWLRVSGSGQEEKSQIRDIDGHIAARGYETGPTYELHAKSATKGEQDEALARVLADIEAGKLDTLVCWHSDRLDRRGPKAAYAFLYAVELAGGKVESVLDPQFGQDDVGAEVLTTVRMATARDEAKLKAERCRIGLETARGNGGFIGRCPWGYEVRGPKRGKYLVATSDGERYIPAIFTRVAEGESCETVAEWMTGETGRRWYGRTITRMIRNPAYKGFVTDASDAITYRSPVLVDPSLWQRANDQLNAEPRRRTGPNKTQAPLAGAVRCGACGEGILTRVKDERYRGGRAGYYRHLGSPCRPWVPALQLEVAVDKLIRDHDHMVFTRELVPGENHEAEILGITFRLSRLGLEGLTEDEEDRKRAELRDERRRLEALPVIPDRWEEVVDPLRLSYGHEWASLKNEDRSRWLRREGYEFRADRTMVEMRTPWGTSATSAIK